MDTSQKLKTFLSQSGWSKVKFAQKMGVHHNTIHNWETGKTPIPHNAAQKIDAALEALYKSSQSIVQETAALSYSASLDDLFGPGSAALAKAGNDRIAGKITKEQYDAAQEGRTAER